MNPFVELYGEVPTRGRSLFFSLVLNMAAEKYRLSCPMCSLTIPRSNLTRFFFPLSFPSYFSSFPIIFLTLLRPQGECVLDSREIKASPPFIIVLILIKFGRLPV